MEEFKGVKISRGDMEGDWKYLNPLTPMNDQDRISPYNINTISTR